MSVSCPQIKQEYESLQKHAADFELAVEKVAAGGESRDEIYSLADPFHEGRARVMENEKSFLSTARVSALAREIMRL